MAHPSELTGKRVMVTGANGFLGAHLVKRLLSEGATVDAVVRAAVEPSSAIHGLGPEVTSHQVDLTDRAAVGRLVERAVPELVIHCAALTHVGQSFDRVDENIRTNIGGTVNLLHALDGRYQRFVYVGSSDVYGDVPTPFREDGPVSPVSPYAVSKYAAERFCRMYHQAYGWPIVCLRPFNAFGPHQTTDRIIPSLILAALAGKDLDMTEGRQTREFMYVDDVVEAFVRALWTPGIEGEVINVSGGQEVSIRELAITVLTLLGNPVQPLFGALDYRPNEIWRMYGDTTKVRALLGWTPTTSLVDGLSATIEWCRTHP
jgi:UDP-glucose 4-epimerase